MNIYIVTYLILNEFVQIEFIVDMAFKDEEQALQYCQQQNGQDRYKICYSVHELKLD